MERVLYVVAREQPLLVGYLRTRAGARAPKGRLVEIKLDERRAERRLSSEARDPDRRSRDRRLRSSLDRDLRSRGYAVVPVESGESWPDEPAPEPVIAWRRRSTWRQRVSRAGRRSWARWGMLIALLAVVGAIVVARSMSWTPAPTPPAAPQVGPPVAPQTAPPVAPRMEQASPPPPTARTETVAPAVPPPPPARPAPGRIVSMRYSGVVLSVDPRARLLVLEDRGAAGGAGRLRAEVAPDARVVLSERDKQPEDLTRPFKDTVINLSDVRRGDYVVVELRGPEGKELARSVSVTLRPH